jgi:hypothetical protein
MEGAGLSIYKLFYKAIGLTYEGSDLVITTHIFHLLNDQLQFQNTHLGGTTNILCIVRLDSGGGQLASVTS